MQDDNKKKEAVRKRRVRFDLPEMLVPEQRVLAGITTHLASKQEPTQKQVRFDLDNVCVNEVPALHDYNCFELYRMYYRQSDYEYFQRTYEKSAITLKGSFGTQLEDEGWRHLVETKTTAKGKPSEKRSIYPAVQQDQVT